MYITGCQRSHTKAIATDSATKSYHHHHVLAGNYLMAELRATHFLVSSLMRPLAFNIISHNFFSCLLWPTISPPSLYIHTHEHLYPAVLIFLHMSTQSQLAYGPMCITSTMLSNPITPGIFHLCVSCYTSISPYSLSVNTFTQFLLPDDLCFNTTQKC